jgi:hypothetical protein
MSPFSSLGGFLHDTFQTTIDWARFIGRFRTFLGPRGRKFLLLSYRFCATDCYVKAHTHTVAIVEKDTFSLLTAGRSLHKKPLMLAYCISGSFTL